MNSSRVKVGLVGVGRMGRVYAFDLAAIPSARLAAIADPDPKKLAEVGQSLGLERRYEDPQQLIRDPEVEAIVIVSPTDTHCELIEAAALAEKAIFCEKPLSISLQEAESIRSTLERTGVFFQMGFMRRFDPGYAAAKARLEDGTLGKARFFKSSSRDPFRPSLEYLDPASSGGIFIDMGIHDFDLALWLMGDIESVSSAGGVLAYPEIEDVGDIDHAVVTIFFSDGQLGVIDLSRSGVYGYDIFTEILGENGALRVGYLRETPLEVLTRNQVAHDTVPYFMERFERAYRKQLADFIGNLIEGRPPPITFEDGIKALRVAEAASRSFRENRPIEVSAVS